MSKSTCPIRTTAEERRGRVLELFAFTDGQIATTLIDEGYFDPSVVHESARRQVNRDRRRVVETIKARATDALFRREAAPEEVESFATALDSMGRYCLTEAFEKIGRIHTAVETESERWGTTTTQTVKTADRGGVRRQWMTEARECLTLAAALRGISKSAELRDPDADPAGKDDKPFILEVSGRPIAQLIKANLQGKRVQGKHRGVKDDEKPN